MNKKSQGYRDVNWNTIIILVVTIAGILLFFYAIYKVVFKGGILS